MAGAASLAFNIIGHDKTKAAFSSAANGAKKLGAGMKAGIAGAAVALAGGGVLSLGNDMIQIASDVGESTSKVITLLGDMADGTLEFAETSAAVAGISKREYLAAVGNIAAVDVAMGTNKKEAAKLANEYVKLSADLGSFNNASSAEVQEALTASIAGEYEMLKRYGIVVNDVTLSQEAQRIGMKKVGSTWDSAQKRQLSYNIVMRSTKAAQGDFARTSGGLANQTKIVQARFEDLKGALGSKLLPAAVKVMGRLNKGIDIAYRLGGALSPLVRGVETFFKALGGGSELNEFSGRLRTANNAGVRVSMWIRNDFLPAAKRFGAWVKTEAIPAVRDFAVKLGQILGPIIASVASTVRTHIIPAVERLIGRFKEAWPTIQRVLSILGNLAQFIATKIVPVVLNLVGPILGKMIDVMGTVWSIVWKVVGVVIKVGETVVRAGKRFWDFVTDVGSAVESAYNKVKEWIGKAVDKIKAMPGDVLNGLGDLTDDLVQKGKDVVQGFINGIKEKAKELPGVVADFMLSPVNKLLPEKLEIHSPSRLTRRYGQWVVEGFALGAKDRTKKVDDAMEAMTARVTKAVDRLKALSEKSRGIASDIKGSFADFGNVSSLETGPDAAKSFLAQLEDRASKAERFDKVVRALRKKGLDKRAIEDLTAAGVEGGLPIAEQLMSGGIGQTNALLKRIRAAGERLGNSEAYARTGMAVDAEGRAIIGRGKTRQVVDLKLSGDGTELVEAIVKALRKKIRASGGDVNVVLGTR